MAVENHHAANSIRLRTGLRLRAAIAAIDRNVPQKLVPGGTSRAGKLGASLASMASRRNSIEANFLRATLPKERGDDELWVFKRERQQRDMAAAAEGKVTQRQLSWFAGGKARNLKIIGAPY